MRPSKSTKDMEVSSLRRNLKIRNLLQDVPGTSSQKVTGNLGWELPKLMEMTILAMRSCEDSVAEEMKKMGLAE